MNHQRYVMPKRRRVMFEDPKSTATKGIEKFLNDRIKKVKHNFINIYRTASTCKRVFSVIEWVTDNLSIQGF